ncbi:hypothetical protein LCD36_04880 [Saccharopolyspora sp. 6T]|uniref:hypothetical protein n=1 Tax=Saccharopolyspora sp. 6T TaxID=2877238 RepID=UPI001CD49E41|nr:hypothetical protein [Saccharopolyspora sp. 6T]MCA1185787.1 hypothetical protein [Saccharopolyspora sp. 6T]
MSAPLTPAQAAATLWQIEQDIDTETQELVRLRGEYAGLLRTHRLEFARAFLGAQGSMDFRRRRAEEQTIDSWYAVQAHEQLVEASKDKLKALRDRSEIGRAINSNLKEEMRFTASAPGWSA